MLLYKKKIGTCKFFLHHITQNLHLSLFKIFKIIFYYKFKNSKVKQYNSGKEYLKCKNYHENSEHKIWKCIMCVLKIQN